MGKLNNEKEWSDALATRITDGTVGSDEVSRNLTGRRCPRKSSRTLEKYPINHLFPSVFPVAFTSRQPLELA